MSSVFLFFLVLFLSHRPATNVCAAAIKGTVMDTCIGSTDDAAVDADADADLRRLFARFASADDAFLSQGLDRLLDNWRFKEGLSELRTRVQRAADADMVASSASSAFKAACNAAPKHPRFPLPLRTIAEAEALCFEDTGLIEQPRDTQRRNINFNGVSHCFAITLGEAPAAAYKRILSGFGSEGLAIASDADDRRRTGKNSVLLGLELMIVSQQRNLYYGLVSELQLWLASAGIFVGGLEGNVARFPRKVRLMRALAALDRVDNVCEIGFNAGHSALAWLTAKSTVSVVSFDLATNEVFGRAVAGPAANFLHGLYPGRLVVIAGDSMGSVSAAANIFGGGLKCQILYVDGGHTEEVAAADLENLRLFADPAYHVVVVDDAEDEDVRAAWTKAVNAGRVRHHRNIDARGGTCWVDPNSNAWKGGFLNPDKGSWVPCGEDYEGRQVVERELKQWGVPLVSEVSIPYDDPGHLVLYSSVCVGEFVFEAGDGDGDHQPRNEFSDDLKLVDWWMR
jgi:hypothetical protein